VGAKKFREKYLDFKSLLKIFEIKEDQKENLENFLKENRGPLLQSWHWGEFQKALKRKIWRFGFEDGGFQISAQIIKHSLPFGKSYLYCPRGPFLRFAQSNEKLKIKSEKIFELIAKKIKEITRTENSIFFRVDPEITLKYREFISALKNLGFVRSKKEVQPKDTLVLDISKKESEILAQMHHKTRYNIGLAKRKGVTVRQSIDLKDVDRFYDLMLETSKRDEFKPHPKEYYQKQIEILGKIGLVKLFVAEVVRKQATSYKLQATSQVIAAIIVSFYGNVATYLHGASGYQYRNLMAPHLLQWEAILEAKKRGCKFYDFWGIQSGNQESLRQGSGQAGIKNQGWAGITRFKKGFVSVGGGTEINYIGAWDLPIQKGWYWMYNLVR
jgi:lipid II:glycine glycyltransferase (peptidoglycan interpeptide bridge formation enzyme)